MKLQGLTVQLVSGVMLMALSVTGWQLYQIAVPLLDPGAFPEAPPPGFREAMIAAPFLVAALGLSGLTQAGMATWLMKLPVETRSENPIYRFNLLVHLTQPPLGTVIAAMLILEDRNQKVSEI